MWVKKEVESNIWKPTRIGEEICGIVREIGVGSFEGTKDYLIETEDLEIVKLPSHKQLLAILDGIRVDDRIKVVHKGSKASGKGNPTMLYEVFVDDGKQQEELVK